MINLYEYQKKYLSDLPARAIMAADTGTGKTFMALAHYATHCSVAEQLIEGKDWRSAANYRTVFNQPLLILAPASKVRTKDWDREITEWFGEGNEPNYKIFSYEKFSRQPSKNKMMTGDKPIWFDYAPSKGGVQHAVICDEVHRAKNPQSLTGKAVFECAKNARFFVGLSATPLPNGWIDFANYMKIWGMTKNITSFKKDFCRYIDVGFPKLVGYQNEAILVKAWNSISKQLTKKEALDLPTRTFIGTDFQRPPEYTRIHKERKLADGTWLETAPALAHALRQSLTAPKLEYVADLLEGTTENVVIFYNYVSERTAILDMLSSKRFKAKTIYRQDGEKHQLPAKSKWDQVKNSITLAQYQSGSTGVEMTYATQVIYFSPTYSYSDYVQSIGRVYRNGQTSKTTFYNLRTPSTIEEAVYECLRNKQDFQVEQWVEVL